MKCSDLRVRQCLVFGKFLICVRSNWENTDPEYLCRLLVYRIYLQHDCAVLCYYNNLLLLLSLLFWLAAMFSRNAREYRKSAFGFPQLACDDNFTIQIIPRRYFLVLPRIFVHTIIILIILHHLCWTYIVPENFFILCRSPMSSGFKGHQI